MSFGNGCKCPKGIECIATCGQLPITQHYQQGNSTNLWNNFMDFTDYFGNKHQQINEQIVSQQTVGCGDGYYVASCNALQYPYLIPDGTDDDSMSNLVKTGSEITNDGADCVCYFNSYYNPGTNPQHLSDSLY